MKHVSHSGLRLGVFTVAFKHLPVAQQARDSSTTRFNARRLPISEFLDAVCSMLRPIAHPEAVRNYFLSSLLRDTILPSPVTR
jgi:hypothetical protein